MTDNWIDILPPVPPAETLPAWSWVCIAFLLLLIPFLYRWHQSARRESLRALRHLQRQLSTEKEIHHIPFALSKIIKQRFNVNSIERIVMPDSRGWKNYKHRLVSTCFRKQNPDHEEISSLLSDASYWLRQG